MTIDCRVDLWSNLTATTGGVELNTHTHTHTRNFFKKNLTHTQKTGMVLTTEVSDNNGTTANNWKFLTEIAPLISPCMGSPQTE